MEIDRETLIKLLEAFVDVSEVYARELTLYQMLFSAACKAKGLHEQETQKVVEQLRHVKADEIKKAHQDSYRTLVEKIPRIVDLLDSNRDEALRILKEWKPTSPPN